MKLPNILNIACRAIGFDKFSYRKFISKTVNSIGIVTPTYGDWVEVQGSVQPGIVSSFGGKNISEKDYKDMGLDWTKNHITIWGCIDVHTTVNQDMPDQIMFNGKTFNIIQVADWITQNGWKRCYCVEYIEKDDNAEEDDGI